MPDSDVEPPAAKRILLEVIATTVADAQAAAQAGADRLELITALSEGGLTPSVGMIEAMLDAVRIPVNVIVRPHSRSFVFDTHDQAAMLRDVRAIADARAHGVVIGMLSAAGDIDRDALGWGGGEGRAEAGGVSFRSLLWVR